MSVFPCWRWSAPPCRRAEDEIHYCFGEQATIEAEGGVTVKGTSGPDVIWGGNVIDGGDGDDLICSLSGRDKVFGGDGDDKVDAGDDEDTVEGGPGDDYLVGGTSYNIWWSGGETVSYEHASGPVNVDLTRGIATGEGRDTLVDFMEIIGSEYGDTLRGGSEVQDGGDFIDGRGGHDVLYGAQLTRNNLDMLVGGRGNDRIHGLRGDDYLFGGPGNDSLYGGRSEDGLWGGPGDDHVDGGRNGSGIHDDCVQHSEFFPLYEGSPAGITASLTAGTARGEGTDSLVRVECLGGSEHDDLLSGSDRTNLLEGNGGNDVLKAWGGDDYLYDGPGVDSLLGGMGADSLVGEDSSGGDHFDGSRGRDQCHADADDSVMNCER